MKKKLMVIGIFIYLFVQCAAFAFLYAKHLQLKNNVRSSFETLVKTINAHSEKLNAIMKQEKAK